MFFDTTGKQKFRPQEVAETPGLARRRLPPRLWAPELAQQEEEEEKGEGYHHPHYPKRRQLVPLRGQQGAKVPGVPRQEGETHHQGSGPVAPLPPPA